jgi:hypothetical protein
MIVHGRDTFDFHSTIDCQMGSSSTELRREKHGQWQVVAKITYWDAMGQYILDFSEQVPVDVMQLLIQKAKENNEG